MRNKEILEFDVVIVGGGPSGLSCAIKLKQLAIEKKIDISICVIDKGSEIGSHILSGAVFETSSLNELIPNWKELNSPIQNKVTSDNFYFLTKNNHFKIPNFLLPKVLNNEGNYIISLGELCKWLANFAENLGIEIFPGFAADSLYLSEEKNKVLGVVTKDLGLDKNDNPTDNFTEGVILKAKQTVLAEGARGSLTKKAINLFKLNENSQPQKYGLGLKEVWKVDQKIHKKGYVFHSLGWPLENDTYGGSFMYHYGDSLVSIGFVVGLDYSNPYLSPYNEFQKFKHHPFISKFLNGGERISYGARAISSGGLKSLPKLYFPGGCLIGDSAGFLNAPKIKGTHTSIKSGIIAAESIFESILNNESSIDNYEFLFKKSSLYSELDRVKNFKSFMSMGNIQGSLLFGIDQMFFKGKMPFFTKNYKADHETLENKNKAKKIDYPKPDGKLSFDRLTSVFLTSTNHRENQKGHLRLNSEETPITINYELFDNPETRYCPAGVYEIVESENNKKALQINHQNCIHCKSCDIKDPSQNINWEVPEGAEGPNYQGM